jgi:hypothetical protein
MTSILTSLVIVFGATGTALTKQIPVSYQLLLSAAKIQSDNIK